MDLKKMVVPGLKHLFEEKQIPSSLQLSTLA